MYKKELDFYRCPCRGDTLDIEHGETYSPYDKIINGTIVSSSGQRYQVINGLPDFTYPDVLEEDDIIARTEYDSISTEYDTLQKVTFAILRQNERDFRCDMINMLHLKSDCFVLETGAGTGLNIPFIIDKMGCKGHLFLQDISRGMIENCIIDSNYEDGSNELVIHRSVGNAVYLPFPGGFFDAALSFGGIGAFSDTERAIREMARVVKPGGRVVFGDESVAPWLRRSLYGRILMDNNQHYTKEAPICSLPVNARDVMVKWVMGGAFYLVVFSVGIGEPEADFDYPIPGLRGGTLNTRFFGKLEGVSANTKALVSRAREKSGKSMHVWLEEALLDAAKRTLGEEF